MSFSTVPSRGDAAAASQPNAAAQFDPHNNAQAAYQQLLASANSSALQQQLMLLNGLALNGLAPRLTNPLANPLFQAQLAAAGMNMNNVQQPAFGGLSVQQVAALSQLASTNPLLQGAAMNQLLPNSAPAAAVVASPFAFAQSAPFDFGHEEPRSRKRSKRKKDPAVDVKPVAAASSVSTAPRETGTFTSFKVQKTDNLDLQLQLESQVDEVQKLREQMVQQDELVDELQGQLRALQEENARQRNALHSLSDPDQLRLFQDARFVREFKARQQYLHEIELAAQRRLAAILAATEEVQNSANNTPPSTTPQATPSTSTPSENLSALNPLNSVSMSSIGASSGAAMGMLRQQDGTPSEEHDTLDAMTLAAMSPPASWLADPWSHDIPKPFREKIDLTKIELRPVEPPPNLVEHARMEHWEGQRRWQQQQELVQRHLAALGSAAMPPQGRKLPHASLASSTAPSIPPLPAYAQKIDLAEKVARLRKTTSHPMMEATLVSSDRPLLARELERQLQQQLMQLEQQQQQDDSRHHHQHQQPPLQHDPMVVAEHERHEDGEEGAYGVGDHLDDFLNSPGSMDALGPLHF